MPCYIKVVYTLIDILNQFVYILGLNNIIILSYIVILKCHDNQYQREIYFWRRNIGTAILLSILWSS